MFRFAVGFTIGYVLGSKAGRERYEQIMRLSAKAMDNPAMQGAAGFVRAKVSSLLPGGRKYPERPDLAYLAPEPDVDAQTPWPAA